jgi:hypothetical protein
MGIVSRLGLLNKNAGISGFNFAGAAGNPFSVRRLKAQLDICQFEWNSIDLLHRKLKIHSKF